MRNLVFVMYYIYLMFLVAGASYLVFYKDASAWLYALVVLLSQISPITKSTSTPDKTTTTSEQFDNL